MPKRSNEFQQLVYLLQRQLAGTARVTESRLLNDRYTGSEVEVDITIEAAVGTIPIRIGIECSAEARKTTVEWVREMLGKHASLPIDRSVLVSRSGFTKEAEALATANGMTPLSMREATDNDWRRYVGALGDLRLGSFLFQPIDTGTVHFLGSLPPESLVNDQSLVRVQNRDFGGTLADLIVALLQQPKTFQAIVTAWLAQPEDERTYEGKTQLNLRLEELTEMDVGDGFWLPIQSVDLWVQVSIRDTPLSLVAAQFGPSQVAYGRAENVFNDRLRLTRYVLLSLVGQDGVPARGSLLFPGEHGEQPEVLELNVPTVVPPNA